MKKKYWLDYLPAVLTAVLILVTAVWRQQTVLKTLPTLITLVVQILNAHADRRAFLLGSANALLYGAAYWVEGVYFSVFSAVAISAPIQVWSFFSWRRYSQGSRPKLRYLGLKGNLLTVAAIAVAWVGLCFLPLFNSGNFPVVDALCFVLGVTVSFLVAKRYVDSQYFSMVNSAISLVLWILLTVRNPQNFNYIIISAYNLFRVTEAAIVWSKMKNKGEEKA